jgi:DNA-binding response OmpR family regulator
VLEGAGYNCLTCSNADEAAEMVPKVQPMLVLAEAQLQEPGGNLAMRISATSSRRPHVALMSAYPRPPRGDEDYFIQKPIAFDRLIHILEALSRDGAR